jgi:hypothetical protein
LRAWLIVLKIGKEEESGLGIGESAILYHAIFIIDINIYYLKDKSSKN